MPMVIKNGDWGSRSHSLKNKNTGRFESLNAQKMKGEKNESTKAESKILAESSRAKLSKRVLKTIHESKSV